MYTLNLLNLVHVLEQPSRQTKFSCEPGVLRIVLSVF
jgi:hypothetical protein